jgi:hypothetical protein
MRKVKRLADGRPLLTGPTKDGFTLTLHGDNFGLFFGQECYNVTQTSDGTRVFNVEKPCRYWQGHGNARFAPTQERSALSQDIALREILQILEPFHHGPQNLVIMAFSEHLFSTYSTFPTGVWRNSWNWWRKRGNAKIKINSTSRWNNLLRCKCKRRNSTERRKIRSNDAAESGEPMRVSEAEEKESVLQGKESILFKLNTIEAFILAATVIVSLSLSHLNRWTR